MNMHVGVDSEDSDDPTDEVQLADAAVVILRGKQLALGQGHPEAIAWLHSVIDWQFEVFPFVVLLVSL